MKKVLFKSLDARVLHVTPEPVFENTFKATLGANYLTADLHNPRAMLSMDITDIDQEDQSFDVILCNHVLEHVSEDKRAIGELFRILKDDGWVLLTVPITVPETYEDPSITSPAERAKAFGQEDHVRSYGPDFVERLKDAGFLVSEVTPQEIVPGKNTRESLGLTNSSGHIYICTKSC